MSLLKATGTKHQPGRFIPAAGPGAKVFSLFFRKYKPSSEKNKTQSGRDTGNLRQVDSAFSKSCSVVKMPKPLFKGKVARNFIVTLL